MKTNIKVTYPGKVVVDDKFDERIRKLIESIGGKWYAQGYDLTSDIRDICFDLEVK